MEAAIAVTEKLITTALKSLFSFCTDRGKCSRADTSSSALFVSSDLETLNILVPEEDSPNKGSYWLRVPSEVWTQFLHSTQLEAKKIKCDLM